MENDYGFKVSQPGVDVQSAADYQLLMASSWLNLKIAYTGVVTVPASSTTTLVTHNLGYPPFTICFLYDNTTSELSQDPGIRVNNSTVSLIEFSGVQKKIRYYVFRLPINENFQAPMFKASAITEKLKDRDFGIKVLKPGKKMNSTDLRDYTFHSGTRAPMLHNVTYGQTTYYSGTTPNIFWRLNWTNDLGYVPIFFAWTSSDNVLWRPLIGLEQSPPQLGVDVIGNMYVSTIGPTAGYASLMSFKDPYQVSSTTTVTV